MRFTLPLIAFAALATPAAADQLITVKVGYGDIDVTTEEGRAVLEARIDAKLRQACKREGAELYTYGRNLVDEKCVADARTAVRAEVERVAAAEARRGRAVAAN